MAEILEQLPGIIGIIIFGILVLYWFTPFFETLHRIFSKEQADLKQLQTRIEQLEAELLALRQTTAQDSAQSEIHQTGASTSAAIRDSALQTHLQRAVAYKQQTKDLIETAPNQNARRRLENLANQVDTWVDTLQNLASRIDAIKQNELLQQDVEMVPSAIERLAAQIEQEQDVDIKAALQRTLTNRKAQLGTLERLQRLVSQAEIQMENTLASLGTIYSQILTDQSTNQVADYRHLSAEAEEERRVLQDHLEALAEIKLQH